MTQTPGSNWADNLERWSGRADARVVVYDDHSSVANGERARSSVSTEDSNAVCLARRRATTRSRSAAADTRRPPVGHGQARRRRVRRGRAADVGAPNWRRPPLGLARATRWRTSTRCSAGSLEAGVLALRARARRRLRRWRLCSRGGSGASRRRPSGSPPATSTSRSWTAARTSSAQLARAFDRMRLRLAQLERARREFIGNASHELRTPLFSLRGFIELLTDEELDEATRREFLETMREQVDRLQRLAEDLLDLTRLDAGRMHIERQHGRPARGRARICATSSAPSRSRRRTRSNWTTRRRATALGDEGGSCGSAARSSRTRSSTRRAGHARRRVAPPATRSAVADDGPGIRAEHAGHVFDRFYRVDGAQRVRERARAGDRARAGRGDGRRRSSCESDGRTTRRSRCGCRRRSDEPRPFPRENGYPLG